MEYQQTPDVVVFHGNCQDGFTGAWVAWSKFGNEKTTYFPAYHDPNRIPPPDMFQDKAVMFIDFTWKYPVMMSIAAFAKSIVILDHHESAQSDLARFPDFTVGDAASFANGWSRAVSAADMVTCPILAGFDMNRSGAMLAWHFLHGRDMPAPFLVSTVQDRDLWRFELSHTKDITMWLFSFDYDFNTWTSIAEDLETAKGRASAIDGGEAIVRKFNKDLRELLPQVTSIGKINGYSVPIANLPYIFASEGGNILADQHPDKPFAATYYRQHDGAIKVSLRSRRDGANVSEIAAYYGGGGHRNAAGFTLAPGTVWL